MRVSVGCCVLLVAACGGSGPTNGGNSTGGPVTNVSMQDNAGLAPFAFSPATLSVPVGTTVKWTNNGGTAHTSTSDDTPHVWSSGTVFPSGSTSCQPNDPYCQPGSTPAGSFQHTFTTPGTYHYHCEFHGATNGMTGTITVTP